MRRFNFFILALFVFSTLTSCSNDNPLYNEGISSELFSISPITATINIATQQQYQAFFYNQQGLQEDVSNSTLWSVDKPELAEINNNGLLTAKRSGTVIITGIFNAFTATATLHITDKNITNISVTPSERLSIVGLSSQFFSFAEFDDGGSQEITDASRWSSADDSAIILDPGQALALQTNAPAGVEIQADFALQGNSFSDSGLLEITNAQLEALFIDPPKKVLVVGERQIYSAYIKMSSGEFINVSPQVDWSVENVENAVISNFNFNKGELIARSQGKTRVIATLNYAGQSILAFSDLTVIPLALEKIEITPNEITVPKGVSGRYNAIGTFNNGDSRDISDDVLWSVSNSSVASIEPRGLDGGPANALLPGTTSIFAELNGINDQAFATVTAPELDRIEVFPESAEVPLGIDQPYTAIAYFQDGSSNNISKLASWDSLNKTVAEDDLRVPGLARSFAVGTTEIKATWRSKSDSGSLIVNNPAPISVEIQPRRTILPLRSDAPYQAYLTDSLGQVTDVTSQVEWSSSNGNIAEVTNNVDSRGVVHSKNPGDFELSIEYPTATGVLTDSLNITVLSGYVTFINASCLPSNPNIGDTITCECKANLSTGGDKYDCTALATYTPSPDGLLRFFTEPGRQNQAEALSSGSANVYVEFNNSSTNSSVNIQ